MNMVLQQKTPDARVGQIIKLAVMAVGGQGGGVLTGWIEGLARAQGWTCQATSVAGVAQRTGATIYYVEMAPMSEQQPVFALAPAGGDVDVLIAAEMMEVGRAVIRGFVTPDRTTLIGSTHRALAVSEKMVPGDGIADADEVRAAAELAAQQLILADMEQLAVGQGSVISSSLFGALAGSGSLPFPREAFEEAIRAGGKGVEPSLKAFAAGFDAAQNGVQAPEKPLAKPAASLTGPATELGKWQALCNRVSGMPTPVQEMALAGLTKIVDFQDCAYGETYLNRLDHVVTLDSANTEWQLSATAAKYIANAMAYDDIIRVADLKTRRPRLSRIKTEMGAKDANLVELTEFFHPRAEEVASLMPAKMGAAWEANPRRMALLARLFNKGRRLRTHTLRSFLMLHFLGGLKNYRLKTRRHEVEVGHLEAWLKSSLDLVSTDYALAVEMLKNRRLVKGYSDTHARGLTKFATVMGAADLLRGRDDAAEWMNRLREAALQDPKGEALDGALKTVRSFV
ncbi:Indolepyruvate ferredoxin oxidoreductase [Sulfitobacter noctilucicola]|uniref:Indolepyruvate ferredoxin oxidoreductase beta subunit n=1 Tax=Sulfitobacter noctilucicola TaxID=1342301 RepID=A0A7W6Q6A1_9RHOB|nr:indolepyruvate oxidoreductase subunit beta family protein [Sulfitobacter noctilucicola]KIN63870.1 Indolepyruvate ferredoxin oxidoreductase [Sulfitobacter noctilucicola]MBB4174622.1 indolepyruvate ferredoxin oxidoreductase beta subunit [Sulfitobacter noctilucicola]